MMDTWAITSSIKTIASWLGPSIGKHTSRVKAINSQDQPMVGKVLGVPIHPGEWYGKDDMLVVLLEDFQLILGTDFLKTINATIIPHLGGLLIVNGKNPCFVAGVS